MTDGDKYNSSSSYALSMHDKKLINDAIKDYVEKLVED